MSKGQDNECVIIKKKKPTAFHNIVYVSLALTVLAVYIEQRSSGCESKGLYTLTVYKYATVPLV